MSETHIGKDSELETHIPNYKLIESCRTISDNTRYFEGLCLYIHKNIKGGVTLVKNDHSDIIWIKLPKESFKFRKKLFIGFVYMSPINSTVYRNSDIDSGTLLDSVRQDILDFSQVGDTLLMGDINAHIAKDTPDYIQGDVTDGHVPIPDDLYQPDIPISRNTMEVENTCPQGKLLLSLCKAIPLRILNGRRSGDSYGSFTHYPFRTKGFTENPSVIDYGIANPQLLERVRYFRVDDLTELSDHGCISTSIDANFTIISRLDNIPTKPCPERFIWRSPYKEKFYDLINSNQSKMTLRSILKINFQKTQSGVDNAVRKLTNSIIEVARQTLPVLKYRENKRTRTVKKKWYDKSCADMKYELSRSGKKIKHDPLNCVLRHQFNIIKKSYKTLLKQKEIGYVRIIRAKLSESVLKDPKHFWQAIKDLTNDNVNEVNPISAIDNSTWHDYFSRLYSSSNHPQTSDIESSTKPNS